MIGFENQLTWQSFLYPVFTAIFVVVIANYSKVLALATKVNQKLTSRYKTKRKHKKRKNRKKKKATGTKIKQQAENFKFTNGEIENLFSIILLKNVFKLKELLESDKKWLGSIGIHQNGITIHETYYIKILGEQQFLHKETEYLG